ncbi:MAG: hypothetical protein K9L66_03060 [Spirochaetaceae bacterium]|nr:hypothetical protein [Spirochaetaceae bacterium]MCF7947769.1 hypothetical protein [Spirochaetia bacterium]MCF7950632.1 hypothetical protein [Spirochaetaceae bacterium]
MGQTVLTIDDEAAIRKSFVSFLEDYDYPLVEALKTANAKLQQINRKSRGSLEEKEVLLREVHHRVKNNTQVIMSLMNLQKPLYRNNNDIRLIEKSIHRIQAMAMAHEQLYPTEDFTQINLYAYLNGMVHEIACRKTAVGKDLDTQIQVQNLYVGLELAIPIGLIIHELTDNVFEHVYPDGNGGILQVTAAKEDDVYTITVADKGIGLPEDIEISTTSSLGFMLVQSLVMQIKGKLEVERKNGTLIKLVFKWQE